MGTIAGGIVVRLEQWANALPEGTCNWRGQSTQKVTAIALATNLTYLVFPLDVGADIDADGICDVVDECVGNYDACGVCNGPGEIYDPEATDDDGSGLSWKEINLMLGGRLAEGDCLDDEDEDGICDSVDDCVGTGDTCGICNGPGEIYECGSCTYSEAVNTTAMTPPTQWSSVLAMTTAT